ncbi:MAG: valine--tRNA ligase, partial [Alphaproteobacteria bacterium]
MIEKTYDPAEIEKRIYDAWEESGAFKAGARPDAKPYCIVIPPPNVTGSLHMGHALNNTLQDILVRYERLRGKDVLWQVGTDHAGIATQMVVERKLAQEGNQSRRELGREEFVRRVWEWKAESGGTIVGQLRRLGASCDWSRERFTMDEGLSRAVVKVFVHLYEEGLIYKDKRLVNWDTKLLTAISDLEVVQQQVTGSYKWARESGQPLDHAALGKALGRNPSGHLYYIDYPLDDGSGKITVATTRPETMLGDVAVAVHPKDPKFAHFVERFNARDPVHAILPLVGRRIPIIADEYVDSEKGSGAVKITPAHDFNDFEVGKRHGLSQISIFTIEGKLSEQAPQKYRGNDRFVARRMIIADLDAEGLIEKIEPVTHQVPYGDRSNEVVEPYLTEQWYVRADVLAKPALEAVQRGETVFVPKNWEKTYFNWLNEIQPWCISRQLWWGHQIPAWYAPDGKIFVAENEEAAQAAANTHFGHETPLKRDEDVLDTWFSSALWPFSTLGWPDETKELKRFYKTDVLVTGFDIIFFWVARMMMMGLHVMEEVPFRDVYIHALVRDEKGQKMSKSKGNVIDPLDLIETYGADALRFTLAAMAAQGRDIKLSPARVEGYRNFATKLWNAARFAEMNQCVPQSDFDPATAKVTLNRWIAGESERALRAVSEALQAFRFNEAAGAIYHFIWHVYCDWYLELIKPILAGSDEAASAETRGVAAFVLDRALKLLHPFMP